MALFTTYYNFRIQKKLRVTPSRSHCQRGHRAGLQNVMAATRLLCLDAEGTLVSTFEPQCRRRLKSLPIVTPTNPAPLHCCGRVRTVG
jgi:hypothetical protein